MPIVPETEQDDANYISPSSISTPASLNPTAPRLIQFFAYESFLVHVFISETLSLPFLVIRRLQLSIVGKVEEEENRFAVRSKDHKMNFNRKRCTNLSFHPSSGILILGVTHISMSESAVTISQMIDINPGKSKETSWSGLVRSGDSVTEAFRAGTEVLLLPKSSHRQTFYAHHPPRPSPCDSGAADECAASFSTETCSQSHKNITRKAY